MPFLLKMISLRVLHSAVSSANLPDVIGTMLAHCQEIRKNTNFLLQQLIFHKIMSVLDVITITVSKFVSIY